MQEDIIKMKNNCINCSRKKITALAEYKCYSIGYFLIRLEAGMEIPNNLIIICKKEHST
jgi:hypothetical protein